MWSPSQTFLQHVRLSVSDKPKTPRLVGHVVSHDNSIHNVTIFLKKRQQGITGGVQMKPTYKRFTVLALQQEEVGELNKIVASYLP